MEALTKDFERVSKKQRTGTARTLEGITRLLEECQQARSELAGAPEASTGAHVCLQNLTRDSQATMAVLQDLHKRLTDVDFASQVSTQQKELRAALVKLGKGIEKHLEPDISRALRDIRFDRAVLEEIVAQHLFREGRFELGEAFIKEAGIELPSTYKEPYEQMHSVMEQIKQCNLKPAIMWTREQQALQEGESLAALEFQLHRLQFVQLLQKVDDGLALFSFCRSCCSKLVCVNGFNEGRNEALQYARANLSKFSPHQMVEIQRLMGCLLYAKRLENSPYADLLQQSQWTNILRDFSRVCCSTLGQAHESPLSATVAAGTIALPTLLKLASLLAKNQPEEWNNCEQLPVEIELGKDFVFHSVFACPVSRDQSTEENPPMLMPCGHVLCKVSITKLAKGGTIRPFKCPYCPNETTVQQCKQLHF